ncbi:MAG: OB-fold domain-containing protein [Devosia sp.]
MAGNRPIPSPSPDPESVAFWEAADREEFLLPKCGACGRFHWYPRPICPFCMSWDVEWTTSKGLGRVYSCTVFRKAEAPYAVAYVELDEGPRMLTNIWWGDPTGIFIGQRVQVTFVSASDQAARKIPFFRPIQEP